MSSKQILFPILLLLVSSTMQAQVKKKIYLYELDIIRGLFYQPNTKDPYTGTAIEQHGNGEKKFDAPIKDGKLHGQVREWARNGQKVYETYYEAGVQVKNETQWYESGKKRLEIGYRYGKAEGICQEWHENGKQKSQGLFQNGLEEGFHQWWYDAGEKDQEASFLNGEMNGTTKSWHRNGQLKLETPYNKGKRHGLVKEFFKDGQTKMQGTFTDDIEDKEHLFWSRKGLLLGKKVFDNGKLLQDFNYRSGNIKTSKGYIQIFNQKESFYTIDITGAQVSEGKDPINIIFSVDGMLLQMYDVPLEDGVASNPATLAEVVEQERLFIQKEEDFAIKSTSTAGTTTTGIPYIYWSFQSPRTTDAEQKPRTPITEHYVSLLCNQQVLHLYSVVTKSDDAKAVEAMLQRIANQVSLKKERIDLNEVARSVR